MHGKPNNIFVWIYVVDLPAGRIQSYWSVKRKIYEFQSMKEKRDQAGGCRTIVNRNKRRLCNMFALNSGCEI